jgi:hypothetical protein
MDIPENTILESIVTTIESTILPGLQTRHSKGQAMAILLLLKDLVAGRDIKEEVLAMDISSLRALFQSILKSLEAVDGYEQDEHLTGLKRKILFVLDQGYNDSQTRKIEEEDRVLNELLEFTILAVAQAEKGYQGPPLDKLREIRTRIRRFLKAQFEAKRKLGGKIEMDLLSKV